MEKIMNEKEMRRELEFIYDLEDDGAMPIYAAPIIDATDAGNKNLEEDIENKIKCVLCKEKNVRIKNFPFCSETCQLADLYNWFSEEYIIKD
jgi:endogenous inhibitor of DNA gyrase (YacG/DUF329 family)